MTWKHKYLWFFGFLAALSLGRDDNNLFLQGGAWLFQNLTNIVGVGFWGAFVMSVIAIVFWLLGLIGRSSLIYEVAARDSRFHKPLKKIPELFQVGIRSLPRVILMQLLIWSVVLVLSLVLVVAMIFVTYNAGLNASETENGIWYAVMFFGIAGGATVILLLTIPSNFMDAFAYRAIVLEELSPIVAIRRALQLIKDNLKHILVFALIYGLLALIMGVVIMIVLSPLLLAIVPVMLQTLNQCQSLASDSITFETCVRQMNNTPTFIFASLVSSILGAVFSSVWLTFQSASFTLLYDNLTKKRKKR